MARWTIEIEPGGLWPERYEAKVKRDGWYEKTVSAITKNRALKKARRFIARYESEREVIHISGGLAELREAIDRYARGEITIEQLEEFAA